MILFVWTRFAIRIAKRMQGFAIIIQRMIRANFRTRNKGKLAILSCSFKIFDLMGVGKLLIHEIGLNKIYEFVYFIFSWFHGFLMFNLSRTVSWILANMLRIIFQTRVQRPRKQRNSSKLFIKLFLKIKSDSSKDVKY